MLVRVTVRAESALRELDAIPDRFERSVWAGLDELAQRTAAAARARHPYQNRTRDLEGSTQAQDAEGDVWGDQASSSVTATMPYASYVDAWARGKTGDGLLEPAWNAVSGAAMGRFEQLITEACRG